MSSLYALKLKDGSICPWTIAENKDECWGKAFDYVAYYEGKEWSAEFWKRWKESLQSAKKTRIQNSQS